MLKSGVKVAACFTVKLRSVKGGVTESLAAAGFAREQIVDGLKLFCAIATKPVRQDIITSIGTPGTEHQNA